MDFQITDIDNINLVEKDDFENNPWSVEDASVFLKYCCPECNYQILNHDMFSYHALENHVKSKTLFEQIEEKEQSNVKPEVLNYDSNYESSLLSEEEKTKYQSLLSGIEQGQKRLKPIKSTNSKDPLESNVTHYKRSKRQLDYSVLDETGFDEYEVPAKQTLELPIEDEKMQKKEVTRYQKEQNFSKSKENINQEICSSKTLLCCEFCDFTSTSNDELFNHYTNQHESKPPPLYRCNVCEFVHKDRTSVEIHSFKVHMRHFYCGTCGKTLEKSETLQSHCTKSKQCKVKDVSVCTLCDMVFSKEELNKHNWAIHKANKGDSKALPSCDLCDFKCSTKKALKAKKELNEHILHEHQKGKMKCCPHCDFKRASIKKSMDKIRYHIDKKHPHHGDQKYFCDICKTGFIFEASCKLHNLLIHQKQFTCEICKYVTTFKKSLAVHVARMHTKEKEKNKCDVCFINLPSKFKLKQHKLQKHQSGQKNERRSCSYCDYTTLNWKDLKIHIDSKHPEHGEKKYFCDVCGEGYIYEANCHSHKKTKHEKRVCNICGLALCNNTSLNTHMISIHKIKGTQSFVCEICGFSTFSKPLLKNHKRTCDNQKNQICPHCDYKTHDKTRVHIHIDSKHPDQYDKKFFCSHCPRKFIFEDSLKKHMQNQKTMAKNRAKKISV